MGMGFRLILHKWGSPFQSRFVTTSPHSRLSSPSVRGREASVNLTRSSFPSAINEECDMAYKDLINSRKRSWGGLTVVMDDPKVIVEEVNLTPERSSGHRMTSEFRFLLENLDILEESFADSDALKLEKDILLHLGRLGALKLFDTCLSRTLQASNALGLSDVPTESIGDYKKNGMEDGHLGKVIVRTGKKEQRKSVRERVSLKNGAGATSLSLPAKPIRNVPGKPLRSSARKASNSKTRRSWIARNEAEMSLGVKVVSDLERIRTTLEETTGRMASLSCWAEAAGLDEKALQQQLRFGWYCRNELLKSTRSLVLYIARNYRGKGIAVEDLLQAGSVGVLQGAEKFDYTRGYKFSTYVQYWIRKSMAKMVARNARGILIPCTLSRAINQIQKAQRAFGKGQKKYPDDNEIAKFTGLSLARIEAASKCVRVVGSLDRKMGDCFNAKYLEFVPDTSMLSPEEAVMRQRMKVDIYDLLRGMQSKERQVLVLRFGLKDNQPQSLEQIGRLFNVSKEWVRRIEKKAMTRLRDGEIRRNLSHYANL